MGNKTFSAVMCSEMKLHKYVLASCWAYLAICPALMFSKEQSIKIFYIKTESHQMSHSPTWATLHDVKIAFL